jgi:hypothetical protein
MSADHNPQPVDNKRFAYLNASRRSGAMSRHFQPLETSAAAGSSLWKTPANQEAAP